ncbi:hypothetical protein HCUR_00089 [Holospora curviuscula]|uniref:Uncharacterized protein n=2 Tax=Holospora curviuscula TaxID=1082868 RepID=A0A2S5RHS5_9PROT|nr:hypothetical protein HCUR_00089 [Holospora curviuscula]
MVLPWFSEKNSAWASSDSSKTDMDVLCVVGKRIVKESEINQILEQIEKKKKGKPVSEEEKTRIKEDYITMCQLSEWAKVQKLDELPETKSALDQAYISAALRKLGEDSEQLTKDEIAKEMEAVKKDPDTKESVAIATVIVDKQRKGKENMDEELRKLENLRSDTSGKIFETWAKKFQIDNANGEYKVNELTLKMLKSSPQLSEVFKGMQVGEIKVVPLNQENRLVLIIRFMKKGIATSEKTITNIAAQNMKSKKMQELIKKIKEEFPPKKTK